MPAQNLLVQGESHGNYKRSLGTLQYFDGRISEVDKDYASTRIVFMLGNKRIEVVRNFFPDNSILEYKLDNYLASSVQEEPDKHFVGYLTVFDGRRGKTSNQYERQEINYRSEYSSHPSMNYRRFYMAECV